MKAAFRNIKQVDRFTIFSLFLTLYLFIICFEHSPMSHSMSRQKYFFLNSFFGYAFFPKHFSFFLTDIVIVSMLIFSLCLYGKKAFQLNKSSKLLLLFIFMMFVSLICSPFRVYGPQLFLILNLFIMVMLYVIIGNIVNKDNVHKFLKIVFVCVVLLAAFESFVGLYQYFMQKSIGLAKLHEPKFPAINGTFPQFASVNGSRWIFDNIFKIKHDSNLLFRAVGTFPHPNVFACFMLFSTMASTYLYLFSKRKIVRAFLLFFLFFQVFSVWISFSRSSIIGLSVAAIALLVLSYSTYLNEEYRVKIKVRKFTSLALVYTLTSLILLFPQIQKRGGVVSYTKLSQGSDRGRIVSQKVGWKMMKESLVLGIGMDNYRRHHKSYLLEGKKEATPTIIHNVYAMIATEEGIVGILIFLSFVFSVYIAHIRRRLSFNSAVFLVYFSAFSFIGACDYYPLFGYHQGKIMFLLPAMILSAISQVKYAKREKFNNLAFDNYS